MRHSIRKWDEKKTRKGGKTFLALGKRVRAYQVRIKKAKKLPDTVKTESVPLISLAEVEIYEAGAKEAV